MKYLILNIGILIAISISGCSAFDSNSNEEFTKQSNAIKDIDERWTVETANLCMKSQSHTETLREMVFELTMTDASEMDHIKLGLLLIFDEELNLIENGGRPTRLGILHYKAMGRTLKWPKWDQAQMSRKKLYDIWNDLLDENGNDWNVSSRYWCK